MERTAYREQIECQVFRLKIDIFYTLLMKTCREQTNKTSMHQDCCKTANTSNLATDPHLSIYKLSKTLLGVALRSFPNHEPTLSSKCFYIRDMTFFFFSFTHEEDSVICLITPLFIYELWVFYRCIYLSIHLSIYLSIHFDRGIDC